MISPHSVIDKVYDDVAEGRVAFFTRGGVEYRCVGSLPGYWVSEDGHVWKGNRRPVKTMSTFTTGGETRYAFLQVDGARRSVPLARLVLAAFQPRPHPELTKLVYLDRDAVNCRLDNLRYVRRAEAKPRQTKPPKGGRDRRLSPGEAATAAYMASKCKTADAIARRLCCSEAAVERALREVKQGRKGK